MKNRCLFFIIGTLILTFFFAGCESKPSNRVQNKIVCVLFDLSETTNTPEVRKTYLDKFSMILEKMNHGDVIEAALITEKSVSELNLSIEYSFPSFEFSTDNDMILNAQKRIADSLLLALKDSLLNAADSVLFNPPRKILGTEILSSLQVAERVLSAFPQKKKVLVIFSDMIEESGIANFARDNPNDFRNKSIIEKLKKTGTLPDLKNTVVYVAGATHPDSEKYNGIRKFWIHFFRETGADLKPYNYGAALIRFDQ